MADLFMIAICGGIGAGKSVVSRILAAMGYPVYDCDSRAKELMDASVEIHDALCRQIHPRAVVSACIDRKLISEIVFSDPEALARLNSIVHGAVKSDLMQWAAEMHKKGHSLIFVETAILVSSGLDSMVSAAWVVDAPEDLRILRVGRRNGLSPEAVRARIEAQRLEIPSGNIPVDTIVNTPHVALLPQIHALLDKFRSI